jgi:outer membrane biosynthesis protein TonB
MNWLYYLAEANLYLGVFYLAYCLFLTKETYYQLTRVYLLFACVASFILPVLQIGALKPVEAAVATTVAYALPEYTAPQEYISTETTAPVVIEHHLTVDDYLMYVYLAGAAIVFLMLMVKLFTLFKLMHNAKRIKQEKYKLVYLPQTNVAFSFFNYLFIGAEAEGANTIIRHELVHIRQKHSVDIIFLELLKVVSWFNPFIYLLQNSLKTVHEYIADEQTAAYETDALTYSSFLVNNAYGAGASSITHSFFNYNLLKKRIVMLNQQRSGNLARLKYLVAVPVCAGLLCVSTLAFSKTYGWVDIDPAKPVNVEVPPLPTIATDGYEKLITYLSKTMRYDNALIKPTNILVVINFKVKADGKITDAKISRSGGSVFDALAMNALKSYKGTVNDKPRNRNLVFDFYANNSTPEEMKIVNGNLDNRAGLMVVTPNQQGGPGPVKFPSPGAKAAAKRAAFPIPSSTTPGYEYLQHHIMKTLTYNHAENDQGAFAVVGFDVANDGKLSNIKIEKSAGSKFDAQTLAAYKTFNMPVNDKPGHRRSIVIFYNGQPAAETDVYNEGEPKCISSWVISNPFVYKSKRTSKGFEYDEYFEYLDNKFNTRTVIYDANGKYVSVSFNKATTGQLALLKNKYGYTFPPLPKAPVKFPPPVVTPDEDPAGPVTPSGYKKGYESLSHSFTDDQIFRTGLDYYQQLRRTNTTLKDAVVVVGFNVGEDKKLSNVKVVKGSGSVMDNAISSAFSAFKGDVTDKPGFHTYLVHISTRGHTEDEDAVVCKKNGYDNHYTIAVGSYLPVKDNNPNSSNARNPDAIFRSDLDKFYKGMTSTIKYPAEDIEKGESWIVNALFSVDADHKVKYVQIIMSPSESLSNEVINALKSSTSLNIFKPGSQYIVPVFFKVGNTSPRFAVTGKVVTYNPANVDIPDNQTTWSMDVVSIHESAKKQ